MHKRILSSIIILTGVFSLTISSYAQKRQVIPVSPINADSIFSSKMEYRLIGPFRGGRSAAVAGSYKNKNTFFMGATGGGVWKTNDGGSNWKNISDKYFGSSIGAIAVAQADESIVYVGEGEHTYRGNVSEGIGGIWKTNDGGRTWKNLGLKDARHIVKIIIHPKNADIVWVAVGGHLFGPNEERGIYKTIDGGKTWKKTLYINNQTGASDLIMEPNNTNVLYAGMWRVIRTPYSLESGGDGSGLFKSTDGGETWQNISTKKGLPKGVWGIVGVAVAPSNPDKVYAIIENEKGGLYVSNDGGENFTLASADNNIRQRAWYYSKVFVDPKNENTVYCPNVGFMRSRDGGKSFQSISTPHGDHHDLWIDPEDANRMIVADDGGAQVSFDAGNNWSTYLNQPTVQIYRVSTDNSFPYRILGAQQDNSTIRIKSRTYGGAITDKDWEPTAGAESGYVVADPLNTDIVYGGNYGGYLSRLNHKTGENRAISVWPDNPMGAGADVQRYRFQWNFPIFFSPHNPKKLYCAGNVLFATENEGQTWKALGGDLTRNEKAKQASSGGPITQDNTSVEYYCTIFTGCESALEKDLLWIGSDDGLIHVSKNGGETWQNVTPPNAPRYIMWNCVETDPFKKGTAYFVGTAYKSDDFTPYIYKTEDYGTTWQLITNGINNLHFTRCIRADKVRANLLYAGTEYGMYISNNGGKNWNKFQLNLPIVPITDLTIKENDLIVATQGRGFYVLDDLATLQQQDEQLLNKNIHVFNPTPAYRMEGYVNPNAKNAGMNAPNGIVMHYWLKNVTDSSKLYIKVYDKKGKIIRTFSKDAKETRDKIEYTTGINKFVWDMNYPPAETIEGLILWNGNVGGPKAAPGNYTATLLFDKDSITTSFVIKADPNYQVTTEQYDEQVDLLLTIRDKFSEVQKSIKNIRALRTQINDVLARIDTKEHKDVKQLADTIIKQITTIEEAFHQTKAKSGQDVLNYPIRLNDKISGVYDYVNSGYNAPSDAAKETYKVLAEKANEQLNKLKNIMQTQVVALNKLINTKQLPVIGIKD